MRKVIYIAVALLAAFLAARFVSDALASEETKIQKRLERMAQAFDDTRIGPIADGIATDFKDTHAGYDRSLVLDGLRSLFVQHTSGPFPYRVVLEGTRIDVRPDAPHGGEPRADVTTRARFFATASESEVALWAIDIEAEFVKRDGWQLLSTQHITAEGEWRALR